MRSRIMEIRSFSRDQCMFDWSFYIVRNLHAAEHDDLVRDEVQYFDFLLMSLASRHRLL